MNDLIQYAKTLVAQAKDALDSTPDRRPHLPLPSEPPENYGSWPGDCYTEQFRTDFRAAVSNLYVAAKEVKKNGYPTVNTGGHGPSYQELQAAIKRVEGFLHKM